jgi:hypothetical protein
MVARAFLVLLLEYPIRMVAAALAWHLDRLELLVAAAVRLQALRG